MIAPAAPVTLPPPSAAFPLPWRREILRRSMVRFTEKGVGVRASNGALVAEWWDEDNRNPPPPCSAIERALAAINADQPRAA